MPPFSISCKLEDNPQGAHPKYQEKNLGFGPPILDCKLVRSTFIVMFTNLLLGDSGCQKQYLGLKRMN